MSGRCSQPHGPKPLIPEKNSELPKSRHFAAYSTLEHRPNPRAKSLAPHGGDSARLTCPLCPQEIWAGIYPPHTKGPRETKISWGHRGKLAFWTKSSRPAHVSEKNKKRHHLRLITHADVASFNAAAKRISKADRLQKMGVQNMKYQLIYSM